MLIKRAILEAGAPTVLFLDQYKLDYPFNPERCYSVCDKRFPWEKVCANTPLALACAFEDHATGEAAAGRLEKLGFTHIEHSRPAEKPWCAIASNNAFWAVRENWARNEQLVRG